MMNADIQNRETLNGKFPQKRELFVSRARLFGKSEKEGKMNLGNNIKHILTVVVLLLALLASEPVSAQQDPMYTQYMFNTQTINPAYVGTWNSYGFMVLSRMQWVGIDNAPSTQTFAFQMPLPNEKVGIGVSLINDRIGLERRFGLFSDYSYKIAFGNRTDLWMGLKAGFSNYSHNLSDHVLYPGEEDPTFVGNIDNKFMPNIGFGFFLNKPTYYVGFSVPKLINTTYETEGNNFSVNGEIRNLFMMAGYVREVSEFIIFKPTMLLKVTSGAPLQADISANFLLREKFWLGATYRSGDSFGFIAQWVFDKNLRVGYAIDLSSTNLKNYHNNTHEIMVSYELRLRDQKTFVPRHF